MLLFVQITINLQNKKNIVYIDIEKHYKKID
jgi:hypothetical protein